MGIADFDGEIKFHSPINPNHISHSVIKRKTSTHTFNVPVKKLSSIMKQLGHDRIDILKMDIEGAEYDVIQNIINEKIEIDQILVEFHHRFKEIGISKSKKAMELLKSAGYQLFDVSNSLEEYAFIKR